MTNQKVINGLKEVIKVLLDTKYDMETILSSLSEDITEESISHGVKLTSILRSNTLGLLSVASHHEEMGPASLHWEGGFKGERKIQQVKPALSIKGSNVDWIPWIGSWQHLESV